MRLNLSNYFREHRILQEYDGKAGEETIVINNGEVSEVYDRRGNKMNFVLFVIDEDEDITNLEPDLLLGLIYSLGKEICIVVVHSRDEWETDSIVGLILPTWVGLLLKDVDPKTYSSDTLSTIFKGIHQKTLSPVILKCSAHPDLHPRYIVRNIGRGIPKVCKIDNAPLTDK